MYFFKNVEGKRKPLAYVQTSELRYIELADGSVFYKI
jgi:hypothetical protein